MTKVALLVDTAEGDVVAVQFATPDAARDWEDKHELDLTGRGVVRVVTRAEALKLAKGE